MKSLPFSARRRIATTSARVIASVLTLQATLGTGSLQAQVLMAGMSMPMVPDPLGISMDRLGSGTTWMPDVVALPARRFNTGSWNWMLHGFAFGQYDAQSGLRGESQLGSVNWGMLMATHELTGGRLQARIMLSFDAAGVTSSGYPLLFQSGETFNGEPIHDRQHPHDLWMELGAMYDRPLTAHTGFMLYAAPSGEPALGQRVTHLRLGSRSEPIVETPRVLVRDRRLPLHVGT